MRLYFPACPCLSRYGFICSLCGGFIWGQVAWDWNVGEGKGGGGVGKGDSLHWTACYVNVAEWHLVLIPPPPLLPRTRTRTRNIHHLSHT